MCSRRGRWRRLVPLRCLENPAGLFRNERRDKKRGDDDIAVNATACMSAGQAMLATKAGATYVSLFAGRMSDEGVDSSAVVASVSRWLDAWRYPTRVIVGSIREAINIQDAALAGAHIVTVPPKFLSQMADHKYSRFTVQQFLSDGEASFGKIQSVLALVRYAGGGEQLAWIAHWSFVAVIAVAGYFAVSSYGWSRTLRLIGIETTTLETAADSQCHRAREMAAKHRAIFERLPPPLVR